jgi:hypothetical protein
MLNSEINSNKHKYVKNVAPNGLQKEFLLKAEPRRQCDTVFDFHWEHTS